MTCDQGIVISGIQEAMLLKIVTAIYFDSVTDVAHLRPHVFHLKFDFQMS